MFWEEQFGCQLSYDGNKANANKTDPLKAPSYDHSDAVKNPLCTGLEDLSLTSSSYTDVSQVRISYNVYKAVYAIAHALHALLNCDSAENEGRCDKYTKFTPGQACEITY